MSESQLLADILLAHSRGPVRLWRQNAGRAWQGKIISQDRHRLVLSPYRAVKLGPEGLSDLGGGVSVTITEAMVGQSVMIYAGVEGKMAKGRVSPEQRSFIDTVRSMGGRAGVARSVEDARLILIGESV